MDEGVSWVGPSTAPLVGQVVALVLIDEGVFLVAAVEVFGPGCGSGQSSCS